MTVCNGEVIKPHISYMTHAYCSEFIFILFHQTLVAKENTDTHRYTLNIQIYKYTDTNTRLLRWRQLDCMTSQIYYTVFQKSDAKIQITITMAHLIRINYPLSSFNYRLSDTNVANFNKIQQIVSEQQLLKKWNSKTEFSNMENTD